MLRAGVSIGIKAFVVFPHALDVFQKDNTVCMMSQDRATVQRGRQIEDSSHSELLSSQC